MDAVTAGSSPQCKGNPVLDLRLTSYGWPKHVAGLVCMTPPFGIYAAPRFAECCSGPLFNITEPTDPSDPAYPVSCAVFCQIDPAMDAHNRRYPYSWSDHYMCLTNGGEENSEWNVVCDTLRPAGVPFPTSYESTIAGPWQTKSYFRDSGSGGWVTVDPNSQDAATGTTASEPLARSTRSLELQSSTTERTSKRTETTSTVATTAVTEAPELSSQISTPVSPSVTTSSTKNGATRTGASLRGLVLYAAVLGSLVI